MKRAPLPARPRGIWGGSSWPMEARSFSMKLETFPQKRKLRFCVSCRKRSFSEWAEIGQFAATCG